MTNLNSSLTHTRRAWLAHLRHELRTPLNAILGYSEMLLEDSESSDHTEFIPDLRQIQEAGRRLLELVNVMLSQNPEGLEEASLPSFGARLRHELRTPLTAVIGYSEMLQEAAAETGAASMLSDLEKIRQAGNKLLAVLDEAVNLKEIILGKTAVEMPPVEVPRLVQAVVATPAPAPAPVAAGRILIVDDSPINCDILTRRLQRLGHVTATAENGKHALLRLREETYDLILLDIMMPEMNGYEVLQHLKADPTLRDLPVIIISSLHELDSVAKCIEMGAADYLAKPFEPVLLQARVDACLEKKRFHDKEVAYLEEQKRLNRDLELRNKFIRQTFGRYSSDELVDRLLETEEGLHLGGEICAVTILMADLRGFTGIAERLSPPQVVSLLNIYLGAMTDVILEYQGLINEFIGDAIFVIFGAPTPQPDHATRAVACAIAMQQAMKAVNQENLRAQLPPVAMGIGINTGEVVAGNIGSLKRAKYGVIGSQVNLTSRIESYTVGGQILISEATRQAIPDRLSIEQPMTIEPKGIPHPVTIYPVSGIQGAYNLMLENTCPSLIELTPPQAVRYFLLTEKHLSNISHPGQLRKISPEQAMLQTVHPVPVLSDLKIQLLEQERILGECYGKVQMRVDKEESSFLLALTSRSPEVEELIQQWKEDAGR